MSLFMIILQSTLASAMIVAVAATIRYTHKFSQSLEEVVSKEILENYVKYLDGGIQSSMMLEWNKERPMKFIYNLAIIGLCLYFHLYVLLASVILGTVVLIGYLHALRLKLKIRTL